MNRARDTTDSNVYRFKIYLFVSFTILLCILCNLMGPATALLALPNLHWIDTSHIGNRTFGILNSNSPPNPRTRGPMRDTPCTKKDVAKLRYSCTHVPFASQLDSWVESYIASGEYAYGSSQEKGVTFSLNQTFSASNSSVSTQAYSDFTYWAPSRQVLSSLDYDYWMILAMSDGYDTETFENVTADTLDTYVAYNSSAQLAIQRNGPIIGAIVEYHLDFDNTSTWTSIVDNNLEIRCYGNYSLDSSPLDYDISEGSYTKCVRKGEGWGTGNKRVAFNITNVVDYTTGLPASEVRVHAFTSDKACFLKDGVLPSWLPAACLQPGRVPLSVGCDWDRLFNVEVDDDLYNRTKEVVTIEMSIRTNYTGVESTLTYTVDFVAFLNFTTYQLDPSPLTNPMTLVQTDYLPKTGEVIKVDPAWLLAAWTVDNNGTVYQSRTAAIQMVQGLDALMPGNNGTNLSVPYMALLPVIQTLTLIDFTTDEVAEPDLLHRDADSRHPLLTRNARLFVWAYGFQSRTSKLGLVVVLAGVTVVLGQLVLGFADRRKYRSPTQLLVAALEHAPSSEFKEVEHNEARVASMRFHVQGTMTNAGKYSFKKMAGCTE